MTVTFNTREFTVAFAYMWADTELIHFVVDSLFTCSNTHTHTPATNVGSAVTQCWY